MSDSAGRKVTEHKFAGDLMGRCQIDYCGRTEPEHDWLRTGLDDGPYLPGKAPRKKRAAPAQPLRDVPQWLGDPKSAGAEPDPAAQPLRDAPLDMDDPTKEQRAAVLEILNKSDGVSREDLAEVLAFAMWISECAIKELRNFTAAPDNAAKWTCKVRAAGLTDPPQDCDWPFCGCDEKATEVLEALQEMGLLKEKHTAEEA